MWKSDHGIEKHKIRVPHRMRHERMDVSAQHKRILSTTPSANDCRERLPKECVWLRLRPAAVAASVGTKDEKSALFAVQIYAKYAKLNCHKFTFLNLIL